MCRTNFVYQTPAEWLNLPKRNSYLQFFAQGGPPKILPLALGQLERGFHVHIRGKYCACSGSLAFRIQMREHKGLDESDDDTPSPQEDCGGLSDPTPIVQIFPLPGANAKHRVEFASDKSFGWGDDSGWWSNRGDNGSDWGNNFGRWEYNLPANPGFSETCSCYVDNSLPAQPSARDARQTQGTAHSKKLGNLVTEGPIAFWKPPLVASGLNPKSKKQWEGRVEKGKRSNPARPSGTDSLRSMQKIFQVCEC